MIIVNWCLYLALCTSLNHEFPVQKFMNHLKKLSEHMNDSSKLSLECSYIATKVLYQVYLKHEQCRDAIVSVAIRIVINCDRPDLQEQFVSLIAMLKVENIADISSYLFYHMRVHLIQLADMVMRSEDSTVFLKFMHLLERVILSLVGHPSIILQLLYLDFSMVTINQINYSVYGLSSTEVEMIIAKSNNIEVCCVDIINLLSKRGNSDDSIGVAVVRLFASIALTAFDLVGAKIIIILTKKRANTLSSELRLVATAVLFDLVTIHPYTLWDSVLMTTLKDDLMAKKTSVQSFTITAFCRILRVSLHHQPISLDLHQHAFVDVLSTILTQSKVKQRIDQHICQYHEVGDFHGLLNESNGESQLPLFVPTIRDILDNLHHTCGRSQYKKYIANVISNMIQRIYELVVLRIHDDNVAATMSYIILLLQQYFNILSVYFTHSILQDLELSATTGVITDVTHLYCSLAHEAFEGEFDVDMLQDVFRTISSLDIAAAFTTATNATQGLK